ncbi:MAG TPA: hypothetical protein VLW54_12315 [Candidatus Acidoferrales bacterium]|nr:hypothetical protein [Candidatus Acidoferrales bacterium]
MKREKTMAWMAAGLAALGLSAAVATAWPAGAAGAASPHWGKQKGKNKNAAQEGVLVEDQGTLQIQVDGQPAGSEEFEIRESGGEWTARGSTEVTGENGAKSKVTGKLTLAPDGSPIRYEWTATSPRKAAAAVEFKGTEAKMELKLEGASSPYAQEFHFQAPPVIILDNNMYHQYEILARLYDWEHKEPKTYSVLVPQELTPGSVTAEYGGEQVMDGRKMDVLRVRSSDLEIDLYCDPGQQERMMRLEVPASKAVVVRQSGKK